jgi:hypothetical protein
MTAGVDCDDDAATTEIGACPKTFIIQNVSGGDYALATWAAYSIICLS